MPKECFQTILLQVVRSWRELHEKLPERIGASVTVTSCTDLRNNGLEYAFVHVTDMHKYLCRIAELVKHNLCGKSRADSFLNRRVVISMMPLKNCIYVSQLMAGSLHEIIAA